MLHYNNLLCEVTRLDMIRAAKNQSPDRFLKKNNYSTSDFKNLNFKKLMIDDELLIVLRIGDYTVSVLFNGPFEELRYLVRSMRGPNRVKRLTRTVVQEALSRALDTEDLLVGCTCADWRYRFKYYATQKDYLFGKPENRKPKYTKTNVEDNKGFVCKHILTALYGKRWVPYAANAWLNYMKSNPEITEDYLWPDRRTSKRNSANSNVDSNNTINNMSNDESKNATIEPEKSNTDTSIDNSEEADS